ncbi:signal peptidase I [Streptacidiphilus carbonis]|uniref:signal peptidase I n=1 Tax=Streptacidiphilus carbonis TaxID=105422 RepID=UPI001EEF316D|nr:signal peptidase I [Streptacidiphilus carbonis]
MDQQVAGGLSAEQDAAEPAGRPRRPLWKELPLLIVVALVLSVLIKTFFAQAFSIPSDSMNNALVQHDRVLVDKFSPWFGVTPQRGQVIVFHDPGNWLNPSELPKPSSSATVRDLQSALSWIGLMPSANEADLIKRVIAVGGDTVQCNAGAPVSVDGVALNEPYIYPGATPCDDDPVGTVKIPSGYLWVMGDHRNDSEDSRYQRLHNTDRGLVPLKDVVGRAMVVAWPVSHWATLSVPSTFDQAALPSEHGSAAPYALAGLVALVGAVPVVLWLRRRRGGSAPAADAADE